MRRPSARAIVRWMSGSDVQRLIGDLLQLGRIEQVDHAARTARVRLGEIVTGDLPWTASRAGAVKVWSPPAVGEQVLVAMPEGDAEAAVIMGSLFSSAHAPADTSPDRVAIEMPDGAVISYDHAAHALALALPDGATVAIVANGGVTVAASAGVTIDGPLKVTGAIEADGDVTAKGISLTDHRHAGVSTGGATSGKPVA